MSSNPRETHLRALFNSVIRGEKSLSNSAPLFIEAITTQPDAPSCIDSIIGEPKGLSSLTEALQADTSASAFNKSITTLISYLRQPNVQNLSNGQHLVRIIQSMAKASAFIRAYVQAFRSGDLQEGAQECFAWFLLQLLRLPPDADGKNQYRPVGEDPAIRRRLSNISTADGQQIARMIEGIIITRTVILPEELRERQQVEYDKRLNDSEARILAEQQKVKDAELARQREEILPQKQAIVETTMAASFMPRSPSLFSGFSPQSAPSSLTQSKTTPTAQLSPFSTIPPTGTTVGIAQSAPGLHSLSPSHATTTPPSQPQAPGNPATVNKLPPSIALGPPLVSSPTSAAPLLLKAAPPTQPKKHSPPQPMVQPPRPQLAAPTAVVTSASNPCAQYVTLSAAPPPSSDGRDTGVSVEVLNQPQVSKHAVRRTEQEGNSVTMAHVLTTKREEESRKKQQQEQLQNKLRQISKCPQGYDWYPEGGGYRCGGGSHYVSSAQLGL